MRAPRSRGRQRMVPLCSAGRTAYRGREPPQRCQPQHGPPSCGSDKPARAATIFIHNGAPQALVDCLAATSASRTTGRASRPPNCAALWSIMSTILSRLRWARRPMPPRARMAAARPGVTPRHVQMLFERDGTTFSRFLLDQRLARAHRMLNNPLLADRSISTIAYEAGFGDLSHFNRAFRRRYGETPSDVRARAVV